MNKSVSGLTDDHLHILLDALNAYGGDLSMMSLNVRDYASNGDKTDPKATMEGTHKLGREAVERIEAALADRATSDVDLLVSYNDIRESLTLILGSGTTNILGALDDAVSNNLGD